jgi:hypothetical protein
MWWLACAASSARLRWRWRVREAAELGCAGGSAAAGALTDLSIHARPRRFWRRCRAGVEVGRTPSDRCRLRLDQTAATT